MPLLNNNYSHKLRRILRKALDVSENIFKTKKLLSELTNYVALSLGDIYPEINKNLSKVIKKNKYNKIILYYNSIVHKFYALQIFFRYITL